MQMPNLDCIEVRRSAEPVGGTSENLRCFRQSQHM